MDRAGPDAGVEAARGVSRRRVLAGGAAVAGGAIGFSELVTGQEITETAVIPSPEPWGDDNLAGFMIHVGSPQSPVQTREAANCDYRNWPPDEISAYEATIINRKDAETPQRDINLHVSSDLTVPPGALYLINQFERCEDGYVGVQIERIGRRDSVLGNVSDGPVADVEEDERPNTVTPGSGAIGPGFGVVAAVSGLLGAGLLARLRED